MSEQDAGTCRSCGARLTPDAELCALCGWPVGVDDHDLRDDAPESGPAASDAMQVPPAKDEEGAVDVKPYCHMCGQQNPAGARFCSSCGTKLEQVNQVAQQAISPLPESASAKPVRPKEDVSQPVKPLVDEETQAPALQAEHQVQGWQVGVLIAAGILIVSALYLITGFSKRAFPNIQETPQQAQAETRGQAATQQGGGQAATQRTLPADLASALEALESEAESLSGDALIEKQREIVALLSEASRPDRAAPFQEKIAATVNTAEDWFQAGHFLYDWMDTLQGEQRFIIAERAALAYENGLETTNDLNVRTALAMAYLNTRAPMQGVQQIRQVLSEEPDHLQGNFYYGVMLMQINRLDQAKIQFERVKQLVPEGTNLYEQADMMLENLSTLN